MLTDAEFAGWVSKAFDRFSAYRTLCQDIAENFYPAMADFTRTVETNLSDYASTLMDGTPLNARETLGNAIEAMLCQGDWYTVGTGDDYLDKRPANRAGLNRATNAVRSLMKFRHSNWSDAKKDADMNWVAFGSAVMSVDESEDRTYAIFRSWHLRDCAWIINSDGRIIAVLRRMRMSARDIARKVGKGIWAGPMAPEIERASNASNGGNPNLEFNLVHVVMPAEEFFGSDVAGLRKNRHPFVSIYFDQDHGKFLNRAGTPFLRYVVARNRSIGGLPFGFSPMAMNSIPDARMLQDMALTILEQGQKAVDPPTIGAGNVFTRDINLFAGGHTEVDLEDNQSLRDVFATVDTGQRLGVGLELKQDARGLITESWLLNKLMLPSLRDMREVEVMVRTEEFRRAALPFFSPIERNYHEPLLSMTFDVAVNMRKITSDMFPPEISGGEANFSFQSPLNEAEGKVIVDKYFTSLNILAAGANVDKTVTNIYDLRVATEEALTAGGKAEWIIPEDQRKKADEQADMVAGLTQGADIARQAAGVTADVANATSAAQQAGLAPAAA